MALDDAYATAAQYRAGTDLDDSSQDVEILEYLKAVTRVLERKLGQVFNTTAAAVAHAVEAHGGTRLWLPRPMSTVTGLVVKVDTNGDFTYNLTLAITTDFFTGPSDALAALLTPEELPATFLDINPNSANILGWPDRDRSVQVTAKWGWPAIPVAIQKGVIAITKQVRDATTQPFTLTLESLETQIQMSPGASAVLKELTKQYSKGVVSF